MKQDFKAALKQALLAKRQSLKINVVYPGVMNLLILIAQVEENSILLSTGNYCSNVNLSVKKTSQTIGKF